tara:strand:- start:30056 stop:30610 length:555 start_codon:yes stop_codon:yes gene_type:complete
MKDLQQNIESKMSKALESLKKDFASIRTGRASSTMLDHIVVTAYGSKMPISQVATVSVPEARMLSLQVWDRGMVKDVERAIIDSQLGINPITEGQTIRLPMPDLTEERRRELAKMAAKYAEATKVSMRNIRRDGMDTLKKMEKDSDISEDDYHRGSDEIQKLTDSFTKKSDELFLQKEKDIMQI